MSGRKTGIRPVTAREVLIPLGIAVFLFFGTMLLNSGFTASDEAVLWSALCDALTVPGVLLTGAGLLAVVANQGVFDGISFGVRKAFGQVLSEEKRARMPKTYYDYVQIRGQKRKGSPRMLLIIGGACLAGAAVSLAVYLTL